MNSSSTSPPRRVPVDGTVPSQVSKPERIAFERCYVPQSIPENEIEAYVHRNDQGSSIARPYVPKKGELLSPDRSSMNPSSLSFGSDGTTASVTEMGQVMQISRYLGVGPSSLIAVDDWSTEAPFYVEPRAQDFEDMILNNWGFGKDVGPTDADDPVITHKIQFLRDRWPRVTFSSEEFEIELQWLVHDHVIIQRSIVRNKTDHPIKLKRWVQHHIAIRTLDFVEESPWNVTSSALMQLIQPSEGSTSVDDYYNTTAGPGGYGIIKAHRFLEDDAFQPRNDGNDTCWYENIGAEEESQALSDSLFSLKSGLAASPIDRPAQPSYTGPKPEAAGIVMGLFVNGKALKFDEFKRPKEFEVLPGKPVEITAGYKIMLLTSQISEWKPLVISAAQVDVDRILSQTPFYPLNDPKFDYSIRRNIEHVLSVCSIPVQSGPVWDYEGGVPKDQARLEAKAVALTCGDMSGHRVCPSASFFAFKFLTAIAHHLGQLERPTGTDDPSGGGSLRERIQETCKAHLRWVFKVAKIRDSKFSGNYWVDGTIIPHPYALPWDGPTDTPYQILKAREYIEAFNLPVDQKFVTNLLKGETGQSAMLWLAQLDLENKRNCYAWRHKPRSEFAYFRLDDHIWIWNTIAFISSRMKWEEEIKKLRKIRRDASSAKPESESGSRSVERELADLMHKYEPSRVQREIMRRFTTENKYTNLRTLAVTRSAKQNRFLLHSRDTALFYDGPTGLISDDLDVWGNLLDCQQNQEANQELHWDNPLRYALAMVMIYKGHLIRREGDNSLLYVKDMLTSTMLSNGLFPGRVDPDTKEPALFDYERYRDFYYHVSFEVPCVLWKYGQEARPLGEPVPIQRLIVRRTQRLLSLPITTIPMSSQADGSVTPVSEDGRIANIPLREPGLHKKNVPYNKFIDSHRIVQVDEEWLYEYPEFLDHKPDERSFRCDALYQYSKDSDVEGGGDGQVGTVIKTAMDGIRQRFLKSHDLDPAANLSDRPVECYVLDVPKKGDVLGHAKTYSGQKCDPVDFSSSGGLMEYLRKPRTSEKAKKRFVSLLNTTKDCALACVLSSNEEEFFPMAVFFDRHWNFETSFFDEAARVHNTWETEFHIGFRQVIAWEDARPGFSHSSRSQEDLQRSVVLGGKILTRAAAGYRFNGDFMDRYWTAHLIEYGPRFSQDHTDLRKLLRNNKSSSRQRKVLELLLFNRIVGQMNDSTKEILDLIETRRTTLSLANLSVQTYLKVSSEWEQLRQILEIMKTDFVKVKDTLLEWESREQDRQQPTRWTEDDERKHQDTIKSLGVVSKRKIREFRSHRVAVDSMIASLEAKQEQFRDELELRGNNNIRYFTYATVIFLPLGFSSSLFSMNQVPDTAIVVNLVKVAVIAVAVTVFIVGFAQPLFGFGAQFWKGRMKMIEGRRQAALQQAPEQQTKPKPEVQPVIRKNWRERMGLRHRMAQRTFDSIEKGQ